MSRIVYLILYYLPNINHYGACPEPNRMRMTSYIKSLGSGLQKLRKYYNKEKGICG